MMMNLIECCYVTWPALPILCAVQLGILCIHSISFTNGKKRVIIASCIIYEIEPKLE